MTDDELMRAFEAGQVPDGGFHHEQHVRVAWNYLKAHPLPEALARFCSALKGFAQAQGAPDPVSRDHHRVVRAAHQRAAGA